MRFDFLKIIRELRSELGDNKITIRLGKTGSGKTLLQTELDVLPRLLAGQEVYCCYFINWNGSNLHYFAPRDFEVVKSIRNATIVFDEIRRSFDPRAYELEGEDFRSFVELHRHRHNDIIANTQDISLVAKTIGVQAHNWSQVENVSSSFFSRFFSKVFGSSDLVIREDFLTYQELKRLAVGFELNEDVELKPDWQISRFRISSLLHPELDKYKIELVHRYCPLCRSRQGEQILKEDTSKVCNVDKKGHFTLKDLEFCPKHKNTPLEIRTSGLFDTDYEPEVLDSPVKIVKYRVCPSCGKDHIVK